MPSAPIQPSSPPNGQRPSRWPYCIRLWFGVSEPVGRWAYAASGVALLFLKYSVEALVVFRASQRLFLPWEFLNPVLTIRAELLKPAGEWLAWAWFLWSLPFLWIAVSMSVRRMADAGASPWLGMLVLVPLFNLAFMVGACCMPSAPVRRWRHEASEASAEKRAQSAALAVGVSLVVGGFMLWFSVYLLALYGASLFLGTPLVMSSVAAYLYNRPHVRGWPSSILVGLASVFFAGLALLLFALEGAICVAMAMPLMLPLGVMGGAIGKAIAEATRRPPLEWAAAVLALPLLAGGESLFTRSEEYVVLTSVEIDAPPDVVWRNVVEFPELSPACEWYFRLGIACPQGARLVGNGPGATRYCEFTTGTFVEPITAWEEPRRLAFDVASQPAPMFELSPYRNVQPPHLDHHLRSTRGELLLVPLSESRTRLEGRTWYVFDMFPQSYWTLWSDGIIHSIHSRVLVHIKQLSEQSMSD